jgi:hypothetical protein
MLRWGSRLEVVSENRDASIKRGWGVMQGAMQGEAVGLNELMVLGTFVSAGLRRISFLGLSVECWTC